MPVALVDKLFFADVYHRLGNLAFLHVYKLTPSLLENLSSGCANLVLVPSANYIALVSLPFFSHLSLSSQMTLLSKLAAQFPSMVYYGSRWRILYCHTEACGTL